MKKYLILLEGGGDSVVKIVGQAQWDYLNSPIAIPRGKTGVSETPPPDALSEARLADPEVEGVCRVTTGSGENDRALWLRGKEFDSVREAFAWATKNGASIADEYHGCLY